MLALVGRRLLVSLPVVLLVSLLTFVFVSFLPGNPAEEILGPEASEAAVAELTEQLGLNQPLWMQYWNWLVKAVGGDLGTSIYTGQPVVEVLGDRLPVTLSLIVLATLVSATLGITLGTLSAVRGGLLGRALDVTSMLGFAVPNFWLALVLVNIFALALHLLPPNGYRPLEDGPGDWLRYLALPVVTLAIGGVAAIAKQTRESMLDTLSRDYVDALRAQGIPNRRVVVRHALRNASVPVITVVGLIFVGQLGGAVLVEQVFVLPGLGTLAITATTQHDLPIIQGVAVTFVLIVVAVNLLVDLAYGWLNPKVRVS
ncbi:MAG: ABC transporter permease [Actinomycetota bacterium]|nr:ABC transporter permease [Actinomycetota bacterium]